MTPEPQSHAQPAHEPGPDIPGYRIEGVIGRGATGTVYRAVQLAVDRPVAIKVLHVELSGAKRAVRRLQREARTTARLAHPGIVSAIDMGVVDGLWWYAMELVEGPSLAQRLKEKGRLGQREALRLFIPLCDALQHAFEHGVVHRDIKPANILIGEGGRMRLVDLGLAFAEDDPLLTQAGGTLGTPHYVSPEQARDPQQADVRSDIWSLGATMFHALCGQPPFAGDSVAEILSGVLYARVPDPLELEPKLSKDMALVLRKCLARKPERRYQQPAELLEDLERIRERRPVTVARASLDPLHRDHDPRRRLAWSVAGVLAIVSAAGLLWARPWAGAPTELDDASRAASAWEPLESLRTRALADRSRLSAALVELDEQLEPAAPEESRARLAQVREELRARFAKEARIATNRVRREFDDAVDRGDLRKAAQVLEGAEAGLNEALAPDGADRDALTALLDRPRLSARLDAAREKARDDLEDTVQRVYQDIVKPAAANARKRGDWRQAHDALSRDVREHVERNGIVVPGLAGEDLDEVLDGIDRLVRRTALQDLERDWKLLDEQLAGWVRTRAADIESQMRKRTWGLQRSAREALSREFEAHLAERGMTRERMLDEVSSYAQAQLEQRALELEELDRQLVLEDAAALFADVDRQLEADWSARRYEAVEARWLAELEKPWMESQAAAIRLEIQEAQLLGDLLERAVQRLRALNGRDAEVYHRVWLTGRISTPPDVLQRGFELRVDAGRKPVVYHLALRPTTVARADAEVAEVLDPVGIEQLAGVDLDATRLPTTPRQRLQRALFRHREGDVETALELADTGDLPQDAELGPLSEALLQRLELDERALAMERDRLAREAGELLNLVRREVLHAGDRRTQIQRIDKLLGGEYSDIAAVRDELDWLRRERARLQAVGTATPEELLRESFGAENVTLTGSGRARVVFDWTAGAGAGPAWALGSWQSVVGQGLRSRAAHERADLTQDTPWPRLVLPAPIDLDRPLTVRLELQQPMDSGWPRLTFVTVAGVHVAIVGTDEGSGERPRLHLREGGARVLAEFVKGFDTPSEGVPVEGFARGGEHVLKVELKGGRSNVSVWIDGVKVKDRELLAPSADATGTQSIVLRSEEVVAVHRLVLDAGYR